MTTREQARAEPWYTVPALYVLYGPALVWGAVRRVLRRWGR